MRKLPGKVRIGGIDYEVRIVSDLRDGDKSLNGWIRYDPCLILIDADLNEQMMWVTLIHEVLHGVGDQCGRPIEEDTIESIAYGLYGVLCNSEDLQWAK